MNPFDKIKIIIERHIIGKKIKFIKKVYVLESPFVESKIDNLEEYFRKGLNAKKILKYERDECSFRWVVWYI